MENPVDKPDHPSEGTDSELEEGLESDVPPPPGTTDPPSEGTEFEWDDSVQSDVPPSSSPTNPPSANDVALDPDDEAPELPVDSELPRGELRFRDESRQHGSLAVDRLWQLLVSAYVDRRGGVIIIENADVERKLFLESGDVVVATSTAPDDRLVELLYREGRLGDEAYRKAAKTVGTSGRKVGAILVERGLIASRELFPLVRHHYESIICDSFSWMEGVWRYDPDSALSERILLATPTGEIILEGIRTAARAEDIDAMAPIRCRPISLPTGIASIEDMGLVSEEMDIYRALDGTQSIKKLATTHDMDTSELQKMIAGLTVLGLVQTDGPLSDHPASSERLTGGEPGEIDGSSGVSATRSRVLEKLDAVEEGSYFALLEIKESASGYEIRKAYRRLKAEFALERFAVSALLDLQPQAEKIFEILTEAYEVLREPARREAYRQAIKDIV